MPHINYSLDTVVDVFVVYKGKVLLRQHDKYKIWLAPGGHKENDEDHNQAAIREVKEEVGLEVELYHEGIPETEDGYQHLVAPLFVNRHEINQVHTHESHVYAARATTDQLVLSEEEKSDGCKWFSAEELEDPQYNLSDTLKLYARTALEKLAGK